MKKILAKSLLVIIEAGVEVMADQIKKRRKRNEHPDQMAHVRGGCGAYCVRDRSAAHFSVVGGRWAMRMRNTRRRSIYKG